MFKRSLYLSICFCIMVSFCSYADAYTGAYMTTETDSQGLPVITYHDVDPTGQTYSGQNVIEYNVLDNTPNLTSNTFNGTTDINTAYTDITSTGNTYNGSTDITYSSAIGGNLNSTSDTFQNTSMTAPDADVSFTDPTFNGSVTLSANSISVGSIDQMTDLLDFQNNIMFGVQTIVCQLEGFLQYFTVFALYDNPTSFTITFGNATKTFSWLPYTYEPWHFDSSSQSVVKDTANNHTYYISVLNFFHLKFMEFQSLIKSEFDGFREWYYPLDDQIPLYWRYYNTDTQQSEDIGLAGLMYNISWYLGQLYALQVESGPLAQLADDVESASQNMAQMEENENAVISSVTSSIDSFVPDLNDIGAFTALAWCSNYLQQCWVSLGMYGTVIVIALMLGVCLQFIGYFRYK